MSSFPYIIPVIPECYGVVASNVVDQWLCQRCLHGEGSERCHLCPFQDGALKKTDNGGWAHILCAQYIPEVGTLDINRSDNDLHYKLVR